MNRRRFLLALAGAAVASPARSHSWYSNACCHERDCAPVPAGTVIRKVDGGFQVAVPRREPIYFRNDQIRDSQDAKWHYCRLPDGTPLCLYAPSGA